MTFQAGWTELTWRSGPGTGNHYHFAFNIAPNRVEAAHTWLRERVEILKGPDGNELIEFADWNAKSLYFLDPAGNVAEFIARRALPDSEELILCVSEVGVVGMEHELLSQKPYLGMTSDSFVARGDEEGMLIIVKEARPWFPTQIPAQRASMSVITDHGRFLIHVTKARIGSPPF